MLPIADVQNDGRRLRRLLHSFAFTGYFSDGIIAQLSSTKSESYQRIAIARRCSSLILQGGVEQGHIRS